MSETIPEDVMKTAREVARQSVERPYNEGTMNRATTVIARALMAERERIAAALDYEASVSPCTEDAAVIASCASLVRANFSYKDAEALDAIRNAQS